MGYSGVSDHGVAKKLDTTERLNNNPLLSVRSMMGLPGPNKEAWQPTAKFFLSLQVHYNVGKNLADKGNQTAAIRYYREAVRYCERLAVFTVSVSYCNFLALKTCVCEDLYFRFASA